MLEYRHEPIFDIAKQLAEVQDKIKALEGEAETLKEHAIGLLREQDLQGHATPYGYIKICERASWDFSEAPSVTEANGILKTLKEAAKNNGEAKSTTIRYVTLS